MADEKMIFLIPAEGGLKELTLAVSGELQSGLPPIITEESGEGPDEHLGDWIPPGKRVGHFDATEVLQRLSSLYTGLTREARGQTPPVVGFETAHCHDALWHNESWPFEGFLDQIGHGYDNEPYVAREGVKTLDGFHDWFSRQFGQSSLEKIRDGVFPRRKNSFTDSDRAMLLFAGAIVLADFKIRDDEAARADPFNMDYARAEIPFEKVYNTLVLSFAIYAGSTIDVGKPTKRLNIMAQKLHRILLEVGNQKIARAVPAGIARFRTLLQGIYGPRLLPAASEAPALLAGGPSAKVLMPGASANPEVEILPKDRRALTRKPPGSTDLAREPIDVDALLTLSLPLNLGLRREDAQGLGRVETVGDLFEYLEDQGMTESGRTNLTALIENLREALPRLVPGGRLTGNLMAAVMIGHWRAHRTLFSAPGLPFLDVLFDTIGEAWTRIEAMEQAKKDARTSDAPRSGNPALTPPAPSEATSSFVRIPDGGSVVTIDPRRDSGPDDPKMPRMMGDLRMFDGNAAVDVSSPLRRETTHHSIPSPSWGEGRGEGEDKLRLALIRYATQKGMMEVAAFLTRLNDGQVKRLVGAMSGTHGHGELVEPSTRSSRADRLLASIATRIGAKEDLARIVPNPTQNLPTGFPVGVVGVTATSVLARAPLSILR